MNLLDAYDAILTAAGSLPAERIEARRAEFAARTGAFAAEDAWFEARSRAFWDDAVTRGKFGRDVESTLGDEARAWVPRLERAHRGLFVVEGRVQGARILRDLWSGAAFRVDDVDEGSRDALAVASAPFDARLVGSFAPLHVGMLPGAVFHPEGTAAPIEKVLTAARAKGLATDDVLDALLRMERSLRSLTRMKADYAYRAEALALHATPLPHAAHGPPRGT